MKIELTTEEVNELLRLLENSGSNTLAVKVRDQLCKHLADLEALTEVINSSDKSDEAKRIQKKTAKEIWG